MFVRLILWSRSNCLDNIFTAAKTWKVIYFYSVWIDVGLCVKHIFVFILITTKQVISYVPEYVFSETQWNFPPNCQFDSAICF